MNSEFVKNLFYARVKEWMDSREEIHSSDFHISTMSYGCPRLLYYQAKSNEFVVLSDDVNAEHYDEYMFNAWIGTKLHETPISEKHEYNIKRVYRYNGKEYVVSGTIDEVLKDEAGKIYILDKKFVFATPREMYEHHRKQVQYYSVLYWRENGVKPAGIILLYFNRTERFSSKAVTVFIEEFKEGDLERIEAEMEALTVRVMEAMDKNSLAEKQVSFYCRYCEFFEMCKGNREV